MRNRQRVVFLVSLGCLLLTIGFIIGGCILEYDSNKSTSKSLSTVGSANNAGLKMDKNSNQSPQIITGFGNFKLGKPGYSYVLDPEQDIVFELSDPEKDTFQYYWTTSPVELSVSSGELEFEVFLHCFIEDDEIGGIDLSYESPLDESYRNQIAHGVELWSMLKEKYSDLEISENTNSGKFTGAISDAKRNMVHLFVEQGSISIFYQSSRLTEYFDKQLAERGIEVERTRDKL